MFISVAVTYKIGLSTFILVLIRTHLCELLNISDGYESVDFVSHLKMVE